MIPEDIGIPSEVFHRDFVAPFEQAPGIYGFVTLKKDTLKVKLDDIHVPDGKLGNWKIRMWHLVDLARVNGAKILHFELHFTNEKFLRVMTKIYGEPKIETRHLRCFGDEWTEDWCIFIIPVPQQCESFTLKNKTDSQAVTLPKPRPPAKTMSCKIEDSSDVFVEEILEVGNLPKVLQPFPHHPPAAWVVIDGVYSLVEQLAKNPHLNNALFDLCDELEVIIPDISHLGKNAEQIWIALFQKARGSTEYDFTIEFLPQGDQVVKIESKDFAAIFIQRSSHEIIAEACGFDVLLSLGLQHLQVPRLLNIGKCGGDYVLGRTYQPGRTFRDYMKEICSLDIGTPERNLLCQEFAQACRQAGRALGELQSKGWKFQHDPSPHTISVDSFVDDILTKWEEIRDALQTLKIRRPDDYSDYVDFLAENLKKNPGIPTYSLGIIHGGQFISSNKGSSFGLMDASYIISDLDKSMKPTAYGAGNFYAFRYLFAREGLLNGLQLKEVGLFEGAFAQGHQSEFRGQLTEEACLFFDFLEKVMTLADLAEGLVEGTIQDRNPVKHIISQLNKQTRGFRTKNLRAAKPQAAPSELDPMPFRTRVRNFIEEELGAVEIPQKSTATKKR